VNNTMVAGSTGGRSESAADFARLLAGIEGSPAGREAAVEPRLAALAAVRDGVITGEGPPTAGRIHFSRCIDAADTALVRRILLAGGNASITRAEADALFDIHEAAVERVDGGAFDDLFTKAITHHVLAAAGERVPARARWPWIWRWPTGLARARLPSTARSRPGSRLGSTASAAITGRSSCWPPASALPHRGVLRSLPPSIWPRNPCLPRPCTRVPVVSKVQPSRLGRSWISKTSCLVSQWRSVSAC
jgi:hypothetical protein